MPGSSCTWGDRTDCGLIIYQNLGSSLLLVGRVFLDILGIQIQPSEIEIHGVFQAFVILESPCSHFDRFDAAVHAFGGTIGDP